jgi:hypothetical protein
MTAEELISGLRERGMVILRSQEPGTWVIIPRLKPDNPLTEWLGKRGAYMRAFQPERWTAPEKREYEAMISVCEVEVEPVLGADGLPDKHLTDATRRLDIWEAACPP